MSQKVLEKSILRLYRELKLVALIKDLIAVVREIETSSSDSASNRIASEEQFRDLSECTFSALRKMLIPRSRHLDHLVDELEVKVEALPPIMVASKLESGEFWSLGTFEWQGEHRSIYRGVLQPTCYLPISRPLGSKLTAFLITIAGDSDLLKRENHGHFGWHYHYLNFKKERSNVILCFDRHAKLAEGDHRPLFWEKHSEGRSKFKARPDSWGEAKRLSIYASCEPDLSNWPIESFKQASKEARAVWPANRVLTSRPSVFV